MTRIALVWTCIYCLGAAIAGAGSALADPVSDFYRGKQVTLIVGTAPGGPYDMYGRLLARHLGDHIPGKPSIIVRNMPGAIGVIATNYAYSAAPQDGTVLVNPHNAIPLMKALGLIQGNMDPSKLNWIGNIGPEVGVAAVSSRSKVRTLDDAKRVQIVMGAASPFALAAMHPRVMNAVLGTKFRVVTGYEGFAAIDTAVERGEIDGNGSMPWLGQTGQLWERYKNGKLNILVQIGATTPDLPNVPLLTDLAKTDEDREILNLFSSPYVIGKPTAMGPHVPPDRVAALRAAYNATMSDPAFLADASKLGIVVSPISGQDLGAMVEHLSALPEALKNRAKSIIQP